MKTTIKKAIALVCAISILMSMATFASAAGTTISVGSVNKINTGAPTTVEIPIAISGNSGLAGIQLNVKYTEGLTLTNVAPGTALESLDFMAGGDLTENPYKMTWDALKNDTSNGTMVTLSFTVPAGVAEYTVDATVVEAYSSEDDVAVSVTNGKIAITEKPKENFTGLSIEDATYTYDGTAKALTVSGVPQGATVTYESADFDADGKAIDAGTYNVTATVKKEGYNDWSDEATLTINPKAISVTGLTATSKVYDGTNEATLSGGTISGLVARDAADQYCDEHNCYRIKCAIPTEGNFADKNVGSNKTVSFGTITLDGCSKDNYTLAQPTVKANITAAPLTVTAKDVVVRKGASTPTFNDDSYTITSGQLFGSDKLTGSITTNCRSTSTVKNYSITQGTLTAGSNYKLTFVPGTLSVVDKTVQNIVVDGVVTEKTYGDDGFKITVTPDENSKLDNFTVASSNSEVATIDESGNVTIKNAGTTTISVKEAGNDEYAPLCYQ